MNGSNGHIVVSFPARNGLDRLLLPLRSPISPQSLKTATTPPWRETAPVDDGCPHFLDHRPVVPCRPFFARSWYQV